MAIPTRILGKTGSEVTILGLGGEGLLRTTGLDDDASMLIHRALDLGITYFDSARAYAGSESYYGNVLRERRSGIFLASKSHARDRRGARHHLEETLRNLKTDHLDLWQVHDIQTQEDIDEIFSPGGAIEAFAEAREQGLTRFLGVTGHADPTVIRECIERFEFDTVLVPVNPAEPWYRSFLSEVVPVARQKQMGIIGMKTYFRGFAESLPFYTSMEPFLRFALSQPVTAVVVGCDDLRQLSRNVAFAERFTPMPEAEQQSLIAAMAPYARQLLYYKP